ncbi:hypothetical protein LCL99_16625 [Halomonas denitrificans]|uniref:hypothetical protein n=1 Tax=Halomonas TaxID=2745 RepID=UPI001A8CAB35|nr:MULTISPECIES: hypothetical protein [Halomonas]MED5296894.1 hypothetical protein [Pseudomonadota bacterium]MBN8411701.1 hypothetical protein [Halomonas litopenaei]MBY5923788.1 hypothetical protein [Halomonas sp. DP4Y7-2]MBY5927935.1 hypothetical protein [Halomonas sp. DP8Y7-3]MBY5967515.1 hypothetical protein [Halomonas denitrificans]
MHIGDTLRIRRELVMVADDQLVSGNTADIIDTSGLSPDDHQDPLPRYRVLIDDVGEHECSCTILDRLT